MYDITQKLCDKTVSEDPFMLKKVCRDKYKTKKCVIKLLILLCKH